MTAWLTQIFISGWISVVAVLVLWSVIAAVAMRSPRPDLTIKTLAPNAISGSCLLAAFGLAMRQAHVLWLAALLAASLIAFLVDLKMRLADQASGLSRRTE
jgi:hypothetical protein